MYMDPTEEIVGRGYAHAMEENQVFSSLIMIYPDILTVKWALSLSAVVLSYYLPPKT